MIAMSFPSSGLEGAYRNKIEVCLVSEYEWIYNSSNFKGCC